MKKLTGLFAVLIFFGLSFVSCKEKNAPAAENVISSSSEGWKNESSFVLEAEGIDELFGELDYTPERAEAQAEYGKLSASAPSAQAGTSQAKSNSMRKLADYKTSYNTARKTYAEVKSSDEDDTVKSNGSGEPLTVLDWGPRGEIVAENDTPIFYVVFSEPVRALTSLSDESDTSDVLSIYPKIEGKFRWLGTDQIAFEASEAAEPAAVYTLTVNENVKSTSGVPISGERVFKTVAKEISVRSIKPGSTPEKSYDYSSDAGVPLKIAGDFLAFLNIRVNEEDFASISDVSDDDGKKYSFTAKPVFSKTVGYGVSFDEKKKTSSVFHVHINDALPQNSNISLRVYKSREKKGGVSSASFWTLRPFYIKYLPSQVGRSSAEMLNPMLVEFNQQPALSGIAKSIKITSPDGKVLSVSDENLKISGRTLYIFNLPIDGYGKQYVLEIAPEFQDVWGQTLQNRNLSGKVRVPDAASYFHLADWGSNMLEWQFPHKIAFDYQNILPGSVYKLQTISDPLQSYYIRDESWFNEGATEFPAVSANTRNIAAVELDDFLKNGFGWIAFDTKAVTRYYAPWDDEYKNVTSMNRLTVQVTDLGITCRVGINRVVAMIRSLSKNEPVSAARVKLVFNSSYSEDDGNFDVIAEGTSGENGVAVFNLTKSQMVQIVSEQNRSLCILVENGDDRALFFPNSHGYYGTNPSRALEEKARVFMFTDRGVYKPGETVTFRGIDKTQKIGRFESYTSGYTIRLVSTSWRNSTVFETIEGEAGDSGGFWGSFELPSDLEPGGYRIEYRRDGQNSYYGDGSVNFTVAYFEPVKIQTSVSIPSTTYFAGDSLNAQIESSYLAGGALSEADYETTWLKNPTDFSSDTAETAGFRFGPLDRYESPNEVSQNAGKLSADGRTTDSCQTSKTSLPVPYRYVVEAAVTDVSNQRISSRASVIVHPSRFYLGVKCSSLHGFPKKGEKIEFPFVMVNPDGEKVNANYAPDGFELEISRITWELSNMNGVGDEIYSRYQKKIESVKKEKIRAESSGTISFTAEKSGRYVLSLSSKDSFGSAVLTEYDFYVTGSDFYWYGDDADELSLLADKKQYNPGDVAQVLLNSPLEAGDYLITVEREGIFTQEVRHFDSSCSVLEIPIAREFVPVVYVSVSSYSVRNGVPTHQYGEKDTDKPRGYYGMTELFVDPMVRAFSVRVESDKAVYRPGEEATLTLKATRDGNPVPGAELTIMAVDRAVLDLINYHVPNPIEFFYNRYNFPLCVQGGDSRNMLMDPVTYAIKNLQGGDADETKENERKEFKPTALFEPAVVTDSDGVAIVSFKVPDNLTTYRVTAFGVKGEQFALNESEIGVRNPINVQSVQPRRLRSRDTAECGVLVTNLDSESHSVKISLNIRSPEKTYQADEDAGLLTLPGSAFVDGKTEQTINVPSGASYTAYFDVAAREEGTVELVYSVKSDVLNERLVSPILIEKTYVYDTVTMSGGTDEEKDAGATEFIQIPSWAEDGEGSLEVTLDATRLGLLSTAVQYVFDYPYGCIEQRTSRTLPLVAFGEYIDVFGLDNRVGNVQKVVKSHFAYLKKYQKSDGGFGLWPESRESSLYVSIRVAHLYALCLEHGYKESDLLIDLDKLVSFIRKEIRTSYGESYRAFAFYVLSMLGSTDDSAVEKCYADVKDKNLTAMTYCGLYFQTRENAARAKEIGEDVRKWMQISERSVAFLVPEGRYYWNYFSTNTEQLAMILKLFSLNDAKDTMVDRLVFTLLSSQKKGYWTSTADTARVLESIYTYIKARNLDALSFTAQAEIMGIKLVDGKFEGAGAKPVTKKWTFDELSKVERGKNVPIEFKKKGRGALYYTATMRYALPDELQNAHSEGIRVSYKITESASGKTLEEQSNTKIIELEAGKTYTAQVVVSTNRDRDYLAVRAPIPSGAEILDATFVTTGSGAQIKSESDSWGHWMSSQTLYDNEAQFFYDGFRKGAATITFRFRTSRRGVYPVPPVQAECMYEPEVFGRADGYLFVIK